MPRRHRRSRALGVAALALGAAACWPSPGQGPNRDAHNPLETGLTAADVPSLTEAWSAPLDGPVFVPRHNPSGQIVTGHGAVYVNDAGALYRFDAATGQRDWHRAVPDVFPADHDPAMAQPFVVGDRLLAAYGSYGDFQGLGADWRTEWLDPDTGAVLDEGPIAAAPVAVRGSTVAGVVAACGDSTFCSGTFVVADLDGTTLATGSHGVHVNNYVPSTLGEARLYHSGVDVGTVSSRIQAFPTTGGAATPLWTRIIQFQGPATAPVLSADGATLYTVSGGSAGPGKVTAIDSATGDVRWSGDPRLAAFTPAPPALADGRLYVPTDDGELVVYDAAGCGAAVCQPLWTASAGAAPSGIGGQPAVAGGVVYTGSDDGTVAAYDAAGCGAATCEPLWTDDAGSAITGSPVVSDGRLYVVSSAPGGPGHVVAYERP
jgi:outer membrane protein assembly factor BamB